MSRTGNRNRMSQLCCALLAACVMGGFTTPLAAEDAEASASLLLILDASGSMWGQLEGENKIVIARRVVGELVDDLPDGQEIGLIAYGHRREGDCDDIETVIPMGALDKEDVKNTVNGLNPKGKTPITESAKRAFALLEQSDTAATVILVSDGLETCGGDPCATVRLAKEQGLDFVLHVVGFDVAGEDVSSLQCAAQAGGGLFLSAENADELSGAIERAVAMSADVPVGRLAVKGVRNGELHDISIVVTDQEARMMGGARTYQSEDTNPSSIPLPDGLFNVKVQAIGIKGDIVREFQIAIKEGSTVERTEDFSTGEISIGVTRNAELSDAVYSIEVAGTDEQAAGGRTYRSEKTNPAAVTITAGNYDVSVGSVEIESRPWVELGEVTVKPGERTELSHEYASGVLKVEVNRSGTLVDASVRLHSEDGKEVAASRTYTGEKTNPTTFVLVPGSYRVWVQEIKGPKTEFNTTVSAEDTVAKIIDFDDL